MQNGVTLADAAGSASAGLALPRLVVFGEALTDFVRTGDNGWRSVAGGACWNAARAAATLGLRTGWAGAVSDDLFGDEIVQKSKAAKLDMRFLQVVPHPPLIAMVHQTHPPQYFFLGNGTADLAFDEARLPAGWSEACEFAHFGCISLVRQPLGERLLDIARRLREKRVRISFDPNYRNLMGPEYPVLFERMAGLADVIKLSDEDLGQIYPAQSSADALARVREVAPETLILFTRGSGGMTLHAPHRSFDQPAFAVEVVDTVGAGDACIGGFVASMLLRPSEDWSEHLRFAAATAAYVCTQPGAHAPTLAQVERLLRESPH